MDGVKYGHHLTHRVQMEWNSGRAFLEDLNFSPAQLGPGKCFGSSCGSVGMGIGRRSHIARGSDRWRRKRLLRGWRKRLVVRILRPGVYCSRDQGVAHPMGHFERRLLQGRPCDYWGGVVFSRAHGYVVSKHTIFAERETSWWDRRCDHWVG